MTIQQPPESGVALIKEFEGCARLVGNKTNGEHWYAAYPDPATGGEPWTIGWGTTKNEYNEPIKPGDTATQEEVDRYLLAECDAGMIILADTIPYWNEMSDDQRGALLSFGYNLGWHFYGLAGFDTITYALRNAFWLPEETTGICGVPDALKRYVKSNGQVMPGLVRRRQAEADLWLQGLNCPSLPPSPPEPPMATYTLEDFFNTYKYWDGSEHQCQAAKYLYAITAEQHLKTYLDRYRTPVETEPPEEPTTPPPYVIIEAPYYNQRDNPSGQGDRECFATSCAMAAVYWYRETGGGKGCKTENKYHRAFPSYGNSTDPNTHLRCLQESFGLNAQFVTNGSAADLKAELDKGRPTPCGWLHHGHVSSPSGGGHYCCAVGYDDDNAQWIFHDPYGEANLVAGGYVVLNSKSPSGVVHGTFIRYSYRNWTPRWSVANDNDGWMMRIWA